MVRASSEKYDSESKIGVTGKPHFYFHIAF